MITLLILDYIIFRLTYNISTYLYMLFSNLNKRKLPKLYDKFYINFLKDGANLYSYSRSDIIDTFVINNSNDNNIEEYIEFIKKNYLEFNEDLNNLSINNLLWHTMPYFYIRDILNNGRCDREVYHQNLAINQFSIWSSVHSNLYKNQLAKITHELKITRLELEIAGASTFNK